MTLNNSLFILILYPLDKGEKKPHSAKASPRSVLSEYGHMFQNQEYDTATEKLNKVKRISALIAGMPDEQKSAALDQVNQIQSNRMLKETSPEDLKNNNPVSSTENGAKTEESTKKTNQQVGMNEGEHFIPLTHGRIQFKSRKAHNLRSRSNNSRVADKSGQIIVNKKNVTQFQSTLLSGDLAQSNQAQVKLVNNNAKVNFSQLFKVT